MNLIGGKTFKIHSWWRVTIYFGTTTAFVVTRIVLTGTQLEPQKKTSYFPLYWMVKRDPYNGLL